MLEKQQLAALFDELGTPTKGQALVREARIKGPVRDVQSNSSNVITIFQSQKMGCEIKTESRHIEYPAAINHEFDASVLEYYAQPCTLQLELVEDATGEIHRIQHTPDFLVVRKNGFTLEEWKSDEKLAKLAQKYPYRYQRNSDGAWRAPQVEEQLAELGMSYVIYTDRSIPRVRVENLLCLADYYHPAAEPCDPEELRCLYDTLQHEGSLFLADLTSSPHNYSIDFLFKAIADRLVVADLDNEPLTSQRRCRLYRDSTYLQFMQQANRQTDILGKQNFVLEVSDGVRFRYGERLLEIVLVSEKEVICRDERGATVPLTRAWLMQAHDEKQITVVSTGSEACGLNLASYSEEQLQRALQRKAMLESNSQRVSERTLRDWRARMHKAASNGANEVLALAPRISARGNRNARLSDEQEALLERIVKERWKTTEAINYTTLYRWVKIGFEQARLTPPSYPTVIARVKAQSDTHDVRIRHGKRRAYQQDAFVDVLYADTPTHGTRALQYVHIDHTQLDIELISDRTGKPLGRPWLSLAVDAFSRRVVGFYLTFDPPAYHSVMMIVRDMVRRFQRLPETIIVDNGRDLTSEAFRSFLRVMGVHLRLRPAGQPRAGAVMERLFGTAHSHYIHNLAGNTKATKDVRSTTGSHLPVNLAEWTLEAMYHGFQHWATNYYDNGLHPTLGCSPRHMFERSLAQNGHRLHRQVLWNEDFLIATCPPTDRGGVRQVHDQRGVKVHDHYYWNPAFRDPKVAGQKLHVRYDPWNASTVYVRVRDQWVAGRCRNLVGLGQLTEAERRALTDEYLHRGGKTLDDTLAQQRLREFMQVFTPEGALATAFDRQQENKSLYNKLGFSAIETPAAVQDRMSLEDGAGSPRDLAVTAPQKEPPPAPETAKQPAIGEPSASPNILDLPDFDTF